MWGCGANPADLHGRAWKMYFILLPLRYSAILYRVYPLLCPILFVISLWLYASTNSGELLLFVGSYRIG